jgi:phosphatidylserine decarboxylase
MNPITFFDRYENRIRTEQVYGDGFLRWTYQTLAGRVTLAAIVKRAIFSRWYGWRMDKPASRKKIIPFIETFGLDVAEFQKQPDQFDHFNDFFARKLTPSSRPIDTDANSIVFPADGRHLCVPDISKAGGLFVKGQMFDLRTLLQNDQLADQFETGSLILSRLCPVDYHRFHFPAAGVAGPTRWINGPLYSVNPIALVQNIQILATNKRCITRLETQRHGTVLLLEIGATCVGSIHQTYDSETRINKGDEKGFFRFGGSSTMVIFEPGRIQFDADLVEHSQQQRELYAKVGDRMGRFLD